MVVGQLECVRVAEEVAVRVVWRLDQLSFRVESSDPLPRLTFWPDEVRVLPEHRLYLNSAWINPVTFQRLRECVRPRGELRVARRREASHPRTSCGGPRKIKDVIGFGKGL